MLNKIVALPIITLVIFACLGCTTTASHYIYATLPSSNEVAVYSEDSSGALTAVSGSPFSTGSTPRSVVVKPSNDFAYVANSGGTDISLFTVASGALTEVTPRTTVCSQPTYLAMDPNGSYLYAACPVSGQVYGFSINSSTGALTQVSGSPFSIGVYATSLKLSPSGGTLYVGGSGGSSNGLIYAYSVNSGVLSKVSSSPFQAGSYPYGLALDSGGSYLYSANILDSSISIFTVDSSGALTKLSSSPYNQSYLSPFSVLVHSSNKYLYVANEGSSEIAAYSISSGALSPLSTAAYNGVTNPNFIVGDSGGNYLFVGNQSSSPGITVFSVDSSTGALTQKSTYSTSAIPGEMFISN